ncbi:MAG: hypothetical protein AAB548_02180 [Patescibacteria group bacterium]
MTDKNVVGQLERLLEPINKKLGVIDKRLDGIDGKLGVIDKRLDGIDGRLDQHQKNFGVINKKLDQHTRALVNIENTIKIYGDMYQINNDNAGKLEKRVVVLEDKNGVEAPPELRLASIS